jgi:hypothetical protein
MKSTIVSATFLILSAFSNGQSANKSGTFSKIDISGNGTVIISKDSVCSYSAGENAELKNDDVSIKNNTLVLNSDSRKTVYVKMPVLEEVKIGGYGSVKTTQQVKSNDLRLEIQGDGKMDIDVEAANINASIPGLGKITLHGSAQSAAIGISGSGKVDALDLKTIKSDVNISGLGKVNIDVIDELNTDISGSGTVSYKTKPKKMNENITGIGKVNTSEEANEGLSVAPDTTRLEFGKHQIWLIGKKDSTHAKTKKIKPIWGGLELGNNSYLDNGGSFTLSRGKTNWDLRVEKSISVGLNLIQDQVELGHSNVWLFSGLGITWNNYRFDNNSIVLVNGNTTTAVVDTTRGVSHIKSKLVASYLTAPVMLEVFTSRNKKHAFHLGAGAMLGLRIGSHTKNKIEINGDDSKLKNFDDWNLNPFRYGFRVAIGYGKLNVFADYYASTLFRNNKGPVLYPVNAGITLIGF